MRFLPVLVLTATLSCQDIDILRDSWGVPHVFAATDAAALRGLGYVTAGDRGFQMHYLLRIVQGRLAEVVGDARHLRRRDTAVLSDRKMRTFGFYRAARQVADALDAETRSLLQAYCDGVNEWFDTHPHRRHYLFAKLGVTPERWTPADCIASWWHMAQFFATDGTRDLIAGRNAERQDRPGPDPALRPDDSAAVVRRSDVSDAWVARLHAYLERHGHRKLHAPQPAEQTRKFSHAWVVGGKKSTTGSTLLVSDPQTPVTNPSLFYEFHIQGRTFNARGIGVPGSPIILIGFTDHVAWGVTALGSDQADLFRIVTDPQHADAYRFDGAWRPMQTWSETIRVKGGSDRQIRLRATHLGPVITEFAFARPDEGEVVARRIPIAETDRDTVQGAFAMLRARNAAAFGKALAGWRFPSANIVFGDRGGSIGYWALGAMPLRSPHATRGGRVAQRGDSTAHAWQDMVPHDLMPHVFDPPEGYLFSGNHRPVASFYPIYYGSMTGSQGDGVRSWRLRELLAATPRFRPTDVWAVHYDTVNPARRELARLGMHLFEVQKRRLSLTATMCLAELEPWIERGCPSDLRVRGAALGTELPMLFRMSNTPLARRFGGGLTGLARFLKSTKAQLDADPQAALPEDIATYVEDALVQAYQSATSKYGRDPKAWPDRARAAVRARRLGYYGSLDGYPELDPAQALAMPDLYCVDGTTIHSQASQSYTQFVDLSDVDSSMSILPPGQTESPDDPFRKANLELWASGRLHPAPLSRTAVERVTRSRQRLAARR